jgi:hypothetical protein
VAIQQNEVLPPLAKALAVAALDAVLDWFARTRFSDRERLREAIGHLAAAAREADVATLEDLHALHWDAALDRASIAFRGVKRALETYELSVDAMLDSGCTEVVSQKGDRARVKVRYELLGKPMSFAVDLVARDGRWYTKDALEAIDRDASGASTGG